MGVVLLYAQPASLMAAETTPPPVAAHTSPASREAATTLNWREENAYTLGVQAFVVGYPWIHLSKTRWRVANVKPTGGAEGVIGYVPYKNTFWQASRLADQHTRTGISPNADTLYGVAWVDAGKEPVILSVPKIDGKRYYTMELCSVDGDNFAYVGTRTTGQAGGNFAIVGPNWKGKLPAGVKRLPASRTPAVLIAERVLVDGPEDFAAVDAWRQQLRLTPLSQWGKPRPAQPERLDVFKPGDPKQDPLADFRTLNRAWAENPPPEKLAPLIVMFKSIGIGPGLDLDNVDADTRRGLERAAVAGMRTVVGSARAPSKFAQRDGWEFEPHAVGRLGDEDMYLERAGLTLAGLVWNDEAESLYIHGLTDSRGQQLDGSKGRYVVRFPPGFKVPADAFWSLSLYAMDYNFFDNPIRHFTIGDRTRGLKRDPDGGLTIYVQSDSPGADKESNWLPAPRDPFYLIFRGYLPQEPMLAHDWVPPPITRVDHPAPGPGQPPPSK
jgi:hypothetical protein